MSQRILKITSDWKIIVMLNAIPKKMTPDQSGREPSAEAQEQGAPKASGEGVDDSEISVRRAGQAEKDAYEKARARAKSQFDASGTADQ